MPGRLVGREKRFFAHVVLDDGRRVTAHCPNTGSMLGCAEPGSRVWLSPADDPRRKLAWTWELVEAGTPPSLVGINTLRANRLAREGLEAGAVPQLAGFARLRAEASPGRGTRFDFLLEWEPARRLWLEVKSVTLAEGRRALFPDAVTARGLKPLDEPVARIEAGDEAALLFVVQREDCDVFAPADAIDPAYGRALRAARAAGVRLLVHRLGLSPEGLNFGPALPLADL